MNCKRDEAADKVSEREELIMQILRAREGDQEAFLALREKYKPLLISQVNRHLSPEMPEQDVDELRQEALIILYNAVCNYDCSSESVEFGLYAKICIENGLASFMRSYFRRLKRVALPLEGIEASAEPKGYDPLQPLVDKESMADLVRMIREQLSDYENRVWWMYVSGMSVADIAKAIGSVEPKSVSNAVYRIRKKLRSLMADLNSN